MRNPALPALSLALLLLALAGGGALACEPALSGPEVRRVEAGDLVLAFRPEPERIRVGRPFALDISVCSRSGADMPSSLKVDATMPEHRHGMNYRPSVNTTAPGSFRADGFMFHMPGRWEFAFEVPSSGKSERLRTSVVIE